MDQMYITSSLHMSSPHPLGFAFSLQIAHFER